MKAIYLLFLLALSAVTTHAQSQRTKAENPEEQFQRTRELVESRHFQNQNDRGYPQKGMDGTPFNPKGEIILCDSMAEGKLPFFGRAYSLPYNGNGSIEFKAPIQNQSMKTTGKKKKKRITYRFSVPGQNDFFQFSIDIAANRNCSVSLTSHNRAHISYSGTIHPLSGEELKQTGKRVEQPVL